MNRHAGFQVREKGSAFFVITIFAITSTVLVGAFLSTSLAKVRHVELRVAETSAFNAAESGLNAAIARRYGLKSGDWVRLKNQDGIVSNRIQVKATERIRGDCVYMVHGFGHQARALRSAFGIGASDSNLITRYEKDAVMGGDGMNVTFVSLELEA